MMMMMMMIIIIIIIIQNHPLAKQFQPNWKMEMSELLCAFYCHHPDDSPAAPSPQSFQAMQEKHPPASVALSDLPRPNFQQSVSVDEATVRQMVLSFSSCSSGGPDGLRPQHIRHLIMCREAGTDLLGALTAFR